MKRILIFISAILVASCNSSDDSDIDLFNAFLKADINGETKTFNVGPNSVAAAISGSTVGSEVFYVFGLGVTTDGISDNSESTNLSMIARIVSPNDIVSGVSFSSENEELSAGYFFETNNSVSVINANKTISANLNISSVDSNNNLISGTFNFSVLDESTDITYTITDGVFSNIPFAVD